MSVQIQGPMMIATLPEVLNHDSSRCRMTPMYKLRSVRAAAVGKQHLNQGLRMQVNSSDGYKGRAA